MNAYVDKIQESKSRILPLIGILFFFLVGFIPAQVTHAQSNTPNIDVSYVKHSQGKFVQTGTDVWLENGKRKFKELGRDEWSVYLQANDLANNGWAKIQLDLWTKQVKYSDSTNTTQRVIYDILSAIDISYVEHSRGKFVQTGADVWLENGKRKFKELGRDEWSVYLQANDLANNGWAKIQLDLWTKQVKYSDSTNTTQRVIYNILNSNNDRNWLSISMIIASDSQWAWTAKTDAGTSQGEGEKEKEATTLNENHVKSMNTLITSLGNIKGVIINGDLTAFGHLKEFDKFKGIYSKLVAPMYLGLGNHDYGNNVDDSYENNAANRMVNYMVAHIKSNGSTNSDVRVSDSYEFPNIVTTTTGSLAYSWDIGNVHFVQLQNYPIYERNWSNYVSIGAAKRRTVKITSAMSWLATDLAKARNAGKIIILNYHDSDEHWGDYVSSSELTTLSTEFKNMLDTYKVRAVFVGHYHTWLGKGTPPRRPNTYGSTPVFYSGSASQSKYLLVNFNGDQMTVEHVSSLDGGTTISKKTTYTVFDQAVAVAIPKEDGWVTFFNEAGYVAKYTLSYSLNREPKAFSTGNIALGNKRRYDIPGNATNIRVKGEGKTGLIWEPWRTTFDATYSSPPNKCFKSYGTTLNQNWNNNCS